MVVTIFIFFSVNGIVAAASTAAALDNVPSNMAGSASALIGSLQYGSGIVSSLLLSGNERRHRHGRCRGSVMVFTTLLSLVMVIKRKALMYG